MGNLKRWPKVSIWQDDHDRSLHESGIARYAVETAEVASGGRVVYVKVQRKDGGPPYQHGIEVHGFAASTLYFARRVRPIPDHKKTSVLADLKHNLNPRPDFVDFV